MEQAQGGEHHYRNYISSPHTPVSAPRIKTFRGQNLGWLTQIFSPLFDLLTDKFSS